MHCANFIGLFQKLGKPIGEIVQDTHRSACSGPSFKMVSKSMRSRLKCKWLDNSYKKSRQNLRKSVLRFLSCFMCTDRRTDRAALIGSLHGWKRAQNVGL
jgi:hypothetical protein